MKRHWTWVRMVLVWASVLGGSLYVCLGERGAANKGNLLHLVAASTPSLPSTEKETGAAEIGATILQLGH